MTTVLLVEDEHLLREGVQEILEAHDFHVIGAADGAEALEWLDQVQVDLVVTDLVMPKMNGVDFVEQVRSKYLELPIIVASGSGTAVTSPAQAISRLSPTSWPKLDPPGAAENHSAPMAASGASTMVSTVNPGTEPTGTILRTKP